MTTEIKLSRISFDPTDLRQAVHPPRLHALDYRRWPGNLPLSVIMTNDHWTAPPAQIPRQ